MVKERIDVLTESPNPAEHRDQVVGVIRRSDWYKRSESCWLAVEGLGDAVTEARVHAWLDELHWVAKEDGVVLRIRSHNSTDLASNRNAGRIRDLHQMGGRIPSPEGRAVNIWLPDLGKARRSKLMASFEGAGMITRERNHKGMGNTVLIELNYEHDLVRQILATEPKQSGSQGLRMDLPAKARRAAA